MRCWILIAICLCCVDAQAEVYWASTPDAVAAGMEPCKRFSAKNVEEQLGRLKAKYGSQLVNTKIVTLDDGSPAFFAERTDPTSGELVKYAYFDFIADCLQYQKKQGFYSLDHSEEQKREKTQKDALKSEEHQGVDAKGKQPTEISGQFGEQTAGNISNPDDFWIKALAGLLVILFVYHVRRTARLENSRKRRKYEDEVSRRTLSLVQRHLKTLCIKLRQKIDQDDYGNYTVDTREWMYDVWYFVQNVLRQDPTINDYLNSNSDANFFKLGVMVANAVLQEYSRQIDSCEYLPVDIASLSPFDFEHFCAETLRKTGWDAQVTKASGDQGIDVIARRGEIKAVFQCKKYSQAVGNSAVQEIIAGKQFEQADVAAVVSNAPYTPSARQLASSTGVYLLHFTDLAEFADKLSIADSKNTSQTVLQYAQENQEE